MRTPVSSDAAISMIVATSRATEPARFRSDACDRLLPAGPVPSCNADPFARRGSSRSHASARYQLDGGASAALARVGCAGPFDDQVVRVTAVRDLGAGCVPPGPLTVAPAVLALPGEVP